LKRYFIWSDGGHMVAAIRRWQGFVESARDRGAIAFFVKDDSWVRKVRVIAHFSVRLEAEVAGRRPSGVAWLGETLAGSKMQHTQGDVRPTP